MMVAKVFLRVLGVIFVVVGVFGFFVPMNGFMDLTVTHNLVHLVSGVLALSLSSRFSIVGARIIGYVYALVAVLGLFVHNVFGLIMLMPGDTVLHFIIAAACLFVGYRNFGGSVNADISKSV